MTTEPEKAQQQDIQGRPQTQSSPATSNRFRQMFLICSFAAMGLSVVLTAVAFSLESDRLYVAVYPVLLLSGFALAVWGSKTLRRTLVAAGIALANSGMWFMAGTLNRYTDEWGVAFQLLAWLALTWLLLAVIVVAVGLIFSVIKRTRE